MGQSALKSAFGNVLITYQNHLGRTWIFTSRVVLRRLGSVTVADSLREASNLEVDRPAANPCVVMDASAHSQGVFGPVDEGGL